MPNWCKGSLKVRGTKASLKTFILEGLHPVGFLGEEREKLSLNEYGDMKIHAFEMGMEFNQVIEIIDGKIVKDEELHFKDYQWDCICPKLGG